MKINNAYRYFTTEKIISNIFTLSIYRIISHIVGNQAFGMHAASRDYCRHYIIVQYTVEDLKELFVFSYLILAAF